MTKWLKFGSDSACSGGEFNDVATIVMHATAKCSLLSDWPSSINSSINNKLFIISKNLNWKRIFILNMFLKFNWPNHEKYSYNC